MYKLVSLLGLFISIATTAFGQLPTSIPAPVWESCKSVCKVTVPRGGYNSCGSGTYIGSNLVLTCAHVIEGGKQGSATFSVTQEKIPFSVVRTDRTLDLAVVQLNREPKVKPVKLTSQPLESGQPIFYVGHPLSSQRMLVTFGVANRHYAPPRMSLQGNTGYQIRSGYSGGATFTSNGELIGPVWGATQGEGYSVPVVNTRRFLFPWNARLAATGLYANSGCSIGQCAPSGGRPALSPMQPFSPGSSGASQGPFSANGATQKPIPPAPINPNLPQVDLDKLADKLADNLKNDTDFLARIRGPQGPAGPRGPAGEDGTSPVVNSELKNALQSIMDKLDEHSVEIDGIKDDLKQVPSYFEIVPRT